MNKDQYRPRLTHAQYMRHINLERNNNILVIGDLHAPFLRADYLDFCVGLRDKWACNEIVFIGDIIDNHYSSFHSSDPDGYSAGEELDRAIDMLVGWQDEFPIAKVILGNHDRLPARKALDAGISSRWLKNYSDVLGTPGWDFVDHYIKDDVMYVHGDGSGHAILRARKDLISIVQGHLHSKAYVEYVVGRFTKVFGMQVGCGVDDDSYAMAYGKNAPQSAIACGIVLNNGKQPIVELMNL